MDYDNKIWIALEKKLVIIDSEFNLVKEILINKAHQFNSLNKPEATKHTLKVSFDRMKIMWYKSNYEVVMFNAKTLQVEASNSNIVKTADIEKFMGFWNNPTCKEIIYFTKKRLIGDSLYFANFEDGYLESNWTFRNKLRKFAFIIFSEGSRCLFEFRSFKR